MLRGLALVAKLHGAAPQESVELEKSELYGSDGRLRPAHRAILGTLRGAPCDVRLAEGEHWGGRSEWVVVEVR